MVDAVVDDHLERGGMSLHYAVLLVDEGRNSRFIFIIIKKLYSVDKIFLQEVRSVSKTQC